MCFEMHKSFFGIGRRLATATLAQATGEEAAYSFLVINDEDAALTLVHAL